VDERLRRIINAKIDEVIEKSEEIFAITRTLQKFIHDQQEAALGIALGRLYNSFHYQTRRVLGRNATDDEFKEFVQILSGRTEEIKDALRKHIR
jgi:hypothetical protein